jgi:hypothetical protein
VQQANDSEVKTPGISGRISQEAFQFFNQESASLKTSRATLPVGCITFCATWEDWVTEQRGAYSQRLNAVRLTNASGCSSWPSPVASEVRLGFQDRSRGMKGSQESLTTVVIKGLPTPNAADSLQGGSTQGNRKDPNLSIAVHGQAVPASSSTSGSRPESWGTPRSCSAMAATITVEAINKAKSGTDRSNYLGNLETQMMTSGVAMPGGKLNPRWVETLMGLPVGWTMPSCASPVTIERMNSDSSVTVLSQQQHNEPSEV